MGMAPLLRAPLADWPRPARLALLILLWLLLAWHWGWLLGWGRLDYGALDWPNAVNYQRIWNEALRTGRLPLHGNVPLFGSTRFLALPEISLSPQAILLALLPLGPAIWINTSLHAGIGLAGGYALAHRFRLRLGPFLWLVLLLGLNGHVVAHLAAGHTMWLAAFWLPWVILFTIDLAEGAGPAGRRLGLVLALLWLQGGFHLFAAWMLFLAAWWLWSPSRRWAIAGAAAWSLGLSAARLLPGLLLVGGWARDFRTGYPNPVALLEALALIRGPETPLMGGPFGAVRWWELDVYVSPLGLAFLVGFGLLAWRGWRGLGRAALSMALLAQSVLYWPLAQLPVFSVERISSRFLIVPLALGIAVAAREAGRRDGSWPGALLAGAAPLAALLLAHSAAWRVAAIEAAAGNPTPPLYLAIAPADDPAYVALLLAGLAISLVVAGGWVRRERGSAPPAAPTGEAGKAG